MNQEQNTGDQPELGLAGKLAKNFIHSPLSPLLFFAMLAMGILGLIFTPRQEDPQISVPMIDIFISYPGASAEEVSSKAIDPLERIMSEIPNVEHVYSASMRDEGMVTVQFVVGEQLGPSIVKVHDKLQSNIDKMPHGVQMPLVKPKGIDDVPVVTFTLWSTDVDDGILHTLALDLLQSIKQIPDTGQGFIVGGRSEQVRVEVMPERLSGYGIGLDQVAQTIQSANSEKRAGSMESGNQYFTVNTGAFLRSEEDISRLVITTHKGNPVYVRDVARVSQELEETSEIVQFHTGKAYSSEEKGADAAPAVTVAVAKKEGSNGVTVANAIIDKIENLKGRIIPNNVSVNITRNYGATANQKVNDLILKLFIATSAVGILIWLSLGLRPAIVVLLVIPVVILLTVFSAWVMGYTIDRVSLFALIFSIGILVDDAIVVIENIYRRWLEKGEMDTETAVDAVREVGNPTILATFTVIAALLPMGFVSGMMGPYMEPIPALGSVAMIFSLIAAFVFTPWLAMRIKPTMAQLQRMEEKEHHSNERLGRLFHGVLNPIIDSPLLGYLTLFTIIGLFFAVCAMFYTTAVTVKMLPLDNKPEFSIVIDMPEGSALPTTANLTSRMIAQIRDIPEVVSLQSYVGTAQPFDFNGMVRHYYLRRYPWQAEIHVQLLDKTERKAKTGESRTSHQIALQVRDLVTPLARESSGKVTVVEMPPGPPVLQAVVADVYGPDDATRRAVATKLTEIFEQSEGLADVDNYMTDTYPIWRFEVDTEKAVRRGISVDTINRNLSMAMGGFRLGDIKQGSILDPVNIILQVPLSIRAQVARLSDLPIPTMSGGTVPLAELGRFVQVDQDRTLFHKDLRPVEYVVGEAVGRLAAPIYAMSDVERLLEGYTTPDGVALESHYLGPPADHGHSAFEWSGEWTVTYETFRDMGAAFGVALVLIYILVVWEFGNFTIPAIIMAPIPLTLIGIIPGHWIMGAEFTATSMIGFIALAGIIVRNSILLVDFSIHQVRQGVDVREAVILACKTRTRPIVITALALVGGSSVILSDYIFQGMAISLLFGVLVSTLLTLVVIPLGCISARAVFCEPGDSCPPVADRAVSPKAPSSGFSLTDLLLGIWRLVALILSALLLKAWQLVIGLIFWIIERIAALFSRKREPIKPTPVPVVRTPPPAAAPSTTTPPAPPSLPPTAATPVATAATETASVAAINPTAQTVATSVEVESSSPVADDSAEAESDSADEEREESRAIIESGVVKKGVTKKVVPGTPISVKSVVPKKRTVPNKKGSSSDSRRGIRLKSDVDDTEL